MAKRRVPLGRAIRWTDKQIDEALTVTPDDIDRARALWQRYAKNKRLIDAQLQDDNANPGGS